MGFVSAQQRPQDSLGLSLLAIEMEKAQHPHPRASRLTETKENYLYAFPAALPFARLAAQARSSALLQAAVIFRFFFGFS